MVRYWRSQWLGVIFALTALLVAAQRWLLGKDQVFLIFRGAFHDLLAGRDLYAAHVVTHLDHFRYSPTFALLFAPLAVLPVPVGLAAWYLLNALALYVAVCRLLAPREARLVLLLVLGDLVRSLQSSQSNALVAALMIGAFLGYERQRVWKGALAVTGGAAIKIFPAGAGVFAILQPARWRSLAAIAVTGGALAALPAVVIGPRHLLQQYQWWRLHEATEVTKPMASLMDFLDAWTGRYWTRWPIQAAGLATLLLPVLRRRDAWDAPRFRRGLLWSLLVFSVLFNHGAEPPSYIIATTGIAAWWATSDRRAWHNVTLALTLLLVTVAGSDLVPAALRDDVVQPARLAVIPLLLAWLAMQAELLRFRAAPETVARP